MRDDDDDDEDVETTHGDDPLSTVLSRDAGTQWTRSKCRRLSSANCPRRTPDGGDDLDDDDATDLIDRVAETTSARAAVSSRHAARGRRRVLRDHEPADAPPPTFEDALELCASSRAIRNSSASYSSRACSAEMDRTMRRRTPPRARARGGIHGLPMARRNLGGDAHER